MTLLRCARPLLGTLVEIRARGEPAAARRAVACAFEAVSRVHRFMSAHDAESDVARLNRSAHRHPVKVDPDTWRVLDTARTMAQASGGAFDICVAPVLARWGYLPAWLGRRDPKACWQDIELLRGCRIRFRRHLAVDVGGIAKGYAVDRAAETLQRHGITRFSVNAGGDLFVGDGPETLHVRDPADPLRLYAIGELSHAAAATSGAYFAQRERHGNIVHPIVTPASRQCAPLEGSVTVLAPQCVVADALTKIVTVLGEASPPVLNRFGAEALLLARGGSLRRLGDPAVSR